MNSGTINEADLRRDAPGPERERALPRARSPQPPAGKPAPLHLTVETPTHRCAIELPASEALVNLRGINWPIDLLDGATVKLDCQPGEKGLAMTQCVSNPSEKK